MSWKSVWIPAKDYVVEDRFRVDLEIYKLYNEIPFEIIHYYYKSFMLLTIASHLCRFSNDYRSLFPELISYQIRLLIYVRTDFPDPWTQPQSRSTRA